MQRQRIAAWVVVACGAVVTVGGPLTAILVGSVLGEVISVARQATSNFVTVEHQLVDTLMTASAALDSAEGVVADAAVETADISKVSRVVQEVVTVEVPAALEQVQAVLPGLEDSARVVDKTMRALRFVGVEYDAEVPLDESVAGLAAGLRPISRTLAAQRDGMSAVTAGLGEMSTGLLSISRDLDRLSGSLRDSAAFLEKTADDAASAEVALVDVERRMGMIRFGASVVMVALGLGMISGPYLWLTDRGPGLGVGGG